MAQYKDGIDKKYIAGLSWDEFIKEAKEQSEAATKHGSHAWYSNFGVEQEMKLRNIWDEAQAEYGKKEAPKVEKK